MRTHTNKAVGRLGEEYNAEAGERTMAGADAFQKWE